MSPVYVFLAIILCHSVFVQDVECCNPALDGKWLNGRMRKTPVAIKDEGTKIEVGKPGHPLSFLFQKFGFVIEELSTPGEEMVDDKKWN